MSDASIYAVKRSCDHIDRLFDIINLAKAGAATTDTSINLDHIPAVQCCVFELIHRLACEAVDMAETSQVAAKKNV